MSTATHSLKSLIEKCKLKYGFKKVKKKSDFTLVANTCWIYQSFQHLNNYCNYNNADFLTWSVFSWFVLATLLLSLSSQSSQHTPFTYSNKFFKNLIKFNPFFNYRDFHKPLDYFWILHLIHPKYFRPHIFFTASYCLSKLRKLNIKKLFFKIIVYFSSSQN